ncbi:tyrosine--tRNA ligase [Sulfobacillus acidophilus]|uniref:Tyrosine--tRNA ligase n=1 Tax=Sulfobacillus acidophilus TaxID=53633 RepID=A0ABS3B0C0_9FIRM|nr:tyrosine--tRNA ligase [Sulfobacillus acidophilus]
MTNFKIPAANKQLKIITRGIVHLEVKSELKKKLEKSHKEQKPLTIKAGFDPTAPDLHIGHAVLLTKMRQFQDLGHRVVFLIGDFTAKIGDPTGKSTTRPALTDEEIVENAATYQRQVYKILDPEKTVIQFNSEWLSGMKFDDVIRLSAKYSVARMIEREDFKIRLSQGKPISMHELLYPLAQGYDSVAIKADVELGGSDQLFNLLVGRDLMGRFNLAPQCILTMPLLEGLEAREDNGKIVGDKMSKSLNNYVGLEEEASIQFGKLMSICDPLMWRYYDLLSLKSNSDIAKLKKGHPKEAKVALAKEIVARFHSETDANKAEKKFNSLFGAQGKNVVPKDAKEYVFAAQKGSEVALLNALVKAKLASSNSEAKRLLKQGAIVVNGNRVNDLSYKLKKGSYEIRAGKKRWAKITIE